MLRTLPKKVRHEGDRLGGIEWALPWLPELGQRPVLAEDDVAEPNDRHHAAVRARIGEACDAAGLVIAGLAIEGLRRPDGLPRAGQVEAHLVAHLVGRRWVDATDPPEPDLAWWPGAWDSQDQSATGSLPLPDALRAYRARHGLSQRQLAERWDMPKKTLAQWEQAARSPSPEGPLRRLMALDGD